MKTSLKYLQINAIKHDLEQQLAVLETKIESWEAEMLRAKHRLVYHQSIDKKSTYWANAIARLENKIGKLDTRIDLYELKCQKLKDCIEHIPLLRKLDNKTLSSSKLSYTFKEKYLPVYREIYSRVAEQERFSSSPQPLVPELLEVPKRTTKGIPKRIAEPAEKPQEAKGMRG